MQRPSSHGNVRLSCVLLVCFTIAVISAIDRLLHPSRENTLEVASFTRLSLAFPNVSHEYEVYVMPGEEIQTALSLKPLVSASKPVKHEKAVFKGTLEMLFAQRRRTLGDFKVLISYYTEDDPKMHFSRENVTMKVHGRYACRQERLKHLCSPSVAVEAVNETIAAPRLWVAQNSIVDAYGRVLSGDVWFQTTSSCAFRDSSFNLTNLKELSQPLFVASSPFAAQYYFHSLLQTVSRVAPFYEELVANNDVSIHVMPGFSQDILSFLGFSFERLVVGPVSTPLSLVPNSDNGCFSEKPFFLLRLREVIQEQLKKRFRDLQARKHILIIWRSETRSILNHDDLLEAISEEFPDEAVTVFRDDPVPSIADSFRLFYEAKVIVGPHGGGLTNMLASLPGAGVVEFLSETGLSDCYLQLARTLGLDYEGVTFDKSTHWGAYDIDINSTIVMLRRRLLQANAKI
jgi:hypothetical protein